MSGSSDFSEGTEKVWRVESYQYTNPTSGRTYPRSIVTNGRCRVIGTGHGPHGDFFNYEEIWGDTKIEFAFDAGIVDPNTYQVFLGRALEKHPEFWTGLPRDADLLRHLLSNLRQALCMLRTGPTEEQRIRTVVFLLSRGWSRWTSLAGFQTEEHVR
jgi:hypothetical protein